MVIIICDNDEENTKFSNGSCNWPCLPNLRPTKFEEQWFLPFVGRRFVSTLV